MLLRSSSSIAGYFLSLIILLLSPSLSHSQTLEERKAGVVKITARVSGHERIGTGFFVNLQGNAVPMITAKSTLEGWGVELIENVEGLLAQEITGKDGAPMVLVPAGEFAMGSAEGEGGSDEHPPHMVDLDAFYIDQYEVTVERYKRFLTQANRAHPKHWEQMELKRDAQKPVVGIDWDDARAYCEWAGKRLPTEAEWEKAARGTDSRLYPWGVYELNSSIANFEKDYEPEKAYAEKLKAVGSYEWGKSPYGVYDMAGNVWEWVADWYDKDYYQASPKKNPQGPSSGEKKVLRGGSWYSYPTALRSSNRLRERSKPRYASLGVRCAQDVP